MQAEITLRQAAQQALTDMKDLEHTISALTGGKLTRLGDAINRLEQALAEPEQNPFGDDAERYARKLHEEREYYKALFAEHKPQTTHWEGCEAVHPECKTELERKSNAIQRLWKERDELRALNAELVEALRGTFQEMLSVVASLNAEQMPHDGDEFHERLEKARAALAKVEASK